MKKEKYILDVKTNEIGDKCEICLKGLDLSYEGLCVENEHCIEKINGVCVRCENNMRNTFCLNSKFRCVEVYFLDCLECDDYLDFNKCTKCKEEYNLNEKFECIDKE